MNNSYRMLIVDDEAHVLSSLRRLFRPSGYEIITTVSAREALAIIRNSEPFTVIISDFRMPEMNGIEFLAEARIFLPDSIRMVLSGFSDSGSVQTASIEGHFDTFISKPWDDTELRQIVAAAFGTYHAGFPVVKSCTEYL